jgi:hypothetical protein
MAVRGMRSDKQSECVFNSVFNIFSTDIVIQHNMREYLDSENRLFEIEGFLHLQIY